MRRGGSFDDVCDHPPGPCDHFISRISAPDVSGGIIGSRGETNHPLFLSLFRDFDD